MTECGFLPYVISLFLINMYEINLLPENLETPFERQFKGWAQYYEEFPVEEVFEKMMDAVLVQIKEVGNLNTVFRDLEKVFSDLNVDWDIWFLEKLILIIKQENDDLRKLMAEKTCVESCETDECSRTQSKIRFLLVAVLNFLGVGK